MLSFSSFGLIEGAPALSEALSVTVCIGLREPVPTRDVDLLSEAQQTWFHGAGRGAQYMSTFSVFSVRQCFKDSYIPRI